MGLALAVVTAVQAQADGVAGKRFFPATIATDDPFVGDEASLPTISWITDPGKPTTHEWGVGVAVNRVLVPDFAVGISDAYIVKQVKGGPAASGWDNLHLSGMYQLYIDEEHEFAAAVGLDAAVGALGTRKVGADGFDTFTPQLFFGKGANELPDSLAYLKPITVTGMLGLGIPDRRASVADGATSLNPHMANWGFAVEYSIRYLQSHVEDVGIGEPFDRMIPLVELAMQTPLDRGQAGITTGTINPGVIWAASTYQVGVEAVIPVNSRSGRGVGVVGQVHFYLDELIPSLFGEPLFGGRSGSDD